MSQERWKPTERQSEFLACSAYEAMLGGSAGGGKTESLVIGALRWVNLREYRGLILRRTFPELNRDIMPLADKYYPWAGGVFNVAEKKWTFPTGAVVEFGHVEGERDVHKYQGLEVQYLAFDELTTFTEKQYVYLLSRVRSASGIPVRVRSATNPGGVGHEWVLSRWAPWLDRRREYKGANAASGQVLRYRNTDNGEEYTEDGSLSRTFIRAMLSDNPHLTKNDPGYEERLLGLDPVTRAQLLRGDWLVRPASGAYFQRAWFPFVDAAPTDVVAKVRRWDLASTENGGDWTVGVRMARLDSGKFVVEDVVRCRMRPHGVRETVQKTAELDGYDCQIVIPQDPGQAGKDQAQSYATMLAGYTIRTPRETGDKIVRAGPASAQAQAKNISLVRAHWNEAFLQTLEAFPTPDVHDDDVDALSGAVTALTQPMTTADYWARADLFGNDEADGWKR
jgi:predicted phage terminase large subunit-like protein